MKVNNSLLLSSCHFSATSKHGFNVARSSDFQENLEKLMFAWSLPSKTLCAWHTMLVRARYGSCTSCGPRRSLRCLNIEGGVSKLCPFLTLSTRVWVLSVSHLVLSNSLQPHGLQLARLLYSCDSPGKNTRVCCHALLQGIFLTQGSNPRLMSPESAGGFFTTSDKWALHILDCSAMAPLCRQIQSATDGVVLKCLPLGKKSKFNWTCTVQIRVVQGSSFS